MDHEDGVEPPGVHEAQARRGVGGARGEARPGENVQCAVLLNRVPARSRDKIRRAGRQRRHTHTLQEMLVKSVWINQAPDCGLLVLALWINQAPVCMDLYGSIKLRIACESVWINQALKQCESSSGLIVKYTIGVNRSQFWAN